MQAPKERIGGKEDLLETNTTETELGKTKEVPKQVVFPRVTLLPGKFHLSWSATTVLQWDGIYRFTKCQCKTKKLIIKIEGHLFVTRRNLSEEPSFSLHIPITSIKCGCANLESDYNWGGGGGILVLSLLISSQHHKHFELEVPNSGSNLWAKFVLINYHNFVDSNFLSSICASTKLACWIFAQGVCNNQSCFVQHAVYIATHSCVPWQCT